MSQKHVSDFIRSVHDCGYDLNLTYPSTAKLPPLLQGPPPANVTDYQPLQGQYGCPDIFSELTVYVPQSSLPWSEWFRLCAIDGQMLNVLSDVSNVIDVSVRTFARAIKTNANKSDRHTISGTR